MADKKFGPWIKKEPINIDITITMQSGRSPVQFNATGGSLIYTSLGNDQYRIWSKDAITRIVPTNDGDRNRYATSINVTKGKTLTSLANFLFPVGSGTLYGFTGLETLIFGSNCEINQITSMKKAFYGNMGANASSFTFTAGGLDTSNVTDFLNCFKGLRHCSSLDLSTFSFDSATEMGYMMRGMQHTTSIILPNSMLTSKPAARMVSLFEDCGSLTCLNLLDTTNATDTNNMFNDCSNLTAPDSTTQTSLLNGSSWTNPNSCP